MSKNDSKYLDNTKKDLIGGITAIVIITALLRYGTRKLPLDADLKAFLAESSDEIGNFTRVVISAALAEELIDEVTGTLSGLNPIEPGYYDGITVNSLLSLYAGERSLINFSDLSEPDFHARCIAVLVKKLQDVVDAVLWCRVDAYELGTAMSPIDLSPIYSSCIPLVSPNLRRGLISCETWVKESKDRWRNSDSTQQAIKLTSGTTTGLSKVLSQLSI